MTDVAVDVLRLRGPGAQRLARVAATTLPAALDRALADVGDVRLDHVRVTLDLSVDDYDDETLAWLWADAIRTQVLAGGRGGLVVAEAGVDAAPSPTAPSGRSTLDVVAAARRWVAASEPGPVDVPAAVLALADPQSAAEARARMSEPEWLAVIAVLTSALASQTVPGRAAAAPEISPVLWAPGTDASVPAAGPAESLPGRRETPPPTGSTGPHHEAEVLARLAAVAQVAPESGAPVALADLTRAAGLVLLYPWLADHCRRAEALHPALDPVDVREAALAAVADPDDPTLADDPLVRILAGRPLSHDVGPRVRMPLSGAREIAESAGGVLAGFAALLPGFERSSEAFVRASWVARAGLLDTDHDPVLLTAATQPLDVLLPRLPYPVGLLKLPWSPPVAVRFR
ncbi:contractile injection system tape measure protein [Terrabacter sp. Soil810]|uniref:contractile injection system tape measure protein n=1 Tax=Terrabacter sp. Soil810 TaxID=1736418 RepID=UPI00070DEFAB|nr:contractile injection system tape measure protein [Terrabacter sp. Soil810]KRF46542.1 hypothetical protein ASG96_00350 [Terrabacter sp. Soil810]